MTRTTGVIFSPVLGRTFFLPGFGASSSLTEVDDELDEELELDEDDEVDDFGSGFGLGFGSGCGFGSGFGSGWGLDGSGSGVGGVCSFSPNPSPDPVSNRTSRVKLRGAGKLVAVHVNILWTISPTFVPGATFVEYSIYIGQL